MDVTKPVFVFGSNLAGRHGLGAAFVAREQYGAIYGRGEGPMGQSYAIPTKDGRDGKKLNRPDQLLSLLEIKRHVDKFLAYAKKNPNVIFKVTAIGTGLAGYKHEDIGPMFYFAPTNCVLPVNWKSFVEPNENRKWWIS